MTPPQDPDAGRRAQVRAVARRLHPDLGGDPEAYLAAMAELDAPTAPRTEHPHAGPHDPAPTGETGTLARARRTARRGLRTAGRAARTRLPRRLPGSRRWARL